MSKANKHKIFSVRSGSSPGGGEEDQDSFIQKALKVYKSLKVKSQTKFAVPLKKTAYNLFFKDMQEKKELKGATVSQASIIIPRKWEKAKANDKEMKKYSDLYEAEKRPYKEYLQRYQEDHIDKVEIISLHKEGNKISTMAGAKGSCKDRCKGS